MYVIVINDSAAPSPTTDYLPGKMWELSYFENEFDKGPSVLSLSHRIRPNDVSTQTT